MQDCFEGKNFFCAETKRHPLFTSKACAQIIVGLFGNAEKDLDKSALHILLEFQPSYFFSIILKAAEKCLWLEDDKFLLEKLRNTKQALPKFPILSKQIILPKAQNIFDVLCKLVLERTSPLVRHFYSSMSFMLN